MEVRLADSVIRFTSGPLTWEEAVKQSAQPLLESATIIPAYVDAMISTVRTHGPYIVLTPGVAVPHARPEAGARGNGAAFLHVDEPVWFENVTEPVHLLIAIAAISPSDHLKLIAELAELLGEQDHVNNLLTAADEEELRLQITKIIAERDHYV